MNTTKHERPGAVAGQVACRVRPLADALDSLCRQLAEREADDAETPLLLTVARATALLNALADAPSAIMDTREALAVCAEREEDFPALYALQGRRVLLVDMGPNPSPQCPECNDTGERDSGGTHPWGEPIYLACDCKDAEVGRRWRTDSSLEAWFPITAQKLRELLEENAHLRAALGPNVRAKRETPHDQA